MEKFAKENKLWNGNGKLNFEKTFQYSSGGDSRLKGGQKLLANLTKNNNFSAFDMISILRDEESGICMLGDGDDCISTGSQVSVLVPKTKKKSQSDACHFFTATPDPQVSLFKPFIFTNGVELGPLTVSTPVEISSKRLHPLYAAHKKASRGQLEDPRLKNLEREGILEVINKLKSSDDNNVDTFETLFHDAVSAEIELLRESPSTKH